MATIKPRRGNGYPTSGLVENELAIDTTNKRIYLGSAGGSGITIASLLTDYVSSVNGATGSITNVAKTDTAQTFTALQSFSAGISGSTGTNVLDIIATTDGCGLRIAKTESGSNARVGGIRLGRSTTTTANSYIENYIGTLKFFNGISGTNETPGTNMLQLSTTNAVFGVPIAGATFSSTIGQVTIQKSAYSGSDSGYLRIVGADVLNNNQYNSDIRANSSSETNTTHTLPATTGTLLNDTSPYVSGICGATGAITLSAGSNITITKSGNTFTFASTASGGGGFTYAASAPGTPSVGDRWIDSDTGKEFVYINDGNSSQWMEPVSSNGLTGVTYNSSTNTLQFNSTVVAPNLMSLTFTPLENQPPASNYATIDTRNGIMVLEFDATTDESATFVSIMPQTAILTNGLKIRINWMADTATSGTCRWGAQIERMNTDLDSDSFDTAATAGSTTNGTSGIITTTEITITTIDSVAVGEPFRLKIYRDADGTSGTDDMTGDAQLVSVEIRSVG